MDEAEGNEEAVAIHCHPSYGRAHDTTAPCWCVPDREDYRPDGGRLLLIHREQN